MTCKQAFLKPFQSSCNHIIGLHTLYAIGHCQKSCAIRNQNLGLPSQNHSITQGSFPRQFHRRGVGLASIRRPRPSAKYPSSHLIRMVGTLPPAIYATPAGARVGAGVGAAADPSGVMTYPHFLTISNRLHEFSAWRLTTHVQ